MRPATQLAPKPTSPVTLRIAPIVKGVTPNLSEYKSEESVIVRPKAPPYVNAKNVMTIIDVVNVIVSFAAFDAALWVTVFVVLSLAFQDTRMSAKMARTESMKYGIL
jgi:hypothetical protein